jgi:hypothetical protein
MKSALFFIFCVLMLSLGVAAENIVVVGEDGSSVLVTGGVEPVVMFRHTVEMPFSGGFFNRPEVWANRQDLRLTSYKGNCLVFLGDKRVATIPMKDKLPGDTLLRYQEHGFTLMLAIEAAGDRKTAATNSPPQQALLKMSSSKPASSAATTNAAGSGSNVSNTVVRIDATITRPCRMRLYPMK